MQEVIPKNISKDWKTSITIPIFKKCDKRTSDNYKGITLLNSSLKLVTKYIC